MTFRPIWTRSIQVFLTFSLALAALGIANGATYYVATTGSDSNSGAQSAPFRHLSKAAVAAQQPGDTVIVMDGTYDNEGVLAPNYVVNLSHSGTAGNPITFKAQNRGGAVLDSMNTSTTTSCNGASAYFDLHSTAFIVIQGFVIQRGCDEGIHSNDSAHDITIKWNEIRNIANRNVTDQIGRDGIYLNSTEFNFTFDGNSFHDIGRTSGQTQLHFDHGIYSHADNVTIINNIFYNMNRGWSIQLADGASNWLVANNTFASGNANGEAGQIMFWGSNTSINVRNNIFYRPNSYAMTRYAATISCTFDHNLIYGVTGVMSDPSGCSMGTNQTGADPKFVNATANDFHLQSGSPAIDSGMTLAMVTTDIDGTARPQGSAFDLGAREYASGGNNPPVISGVFVSSISTNSAWINWSTDKPATSSVQYGLGAYTAATPQDPSLVTLHSVALSNLTASTLYHFRAASQDSAGNLANSPDFTFTTASASTTPDLTITQTHVGNFVQSQTGATYTIIVTNSGTGPTSAAVSVSDTVPAGLTATNIAGSGWSCTQPAGPCNRSNVLAASASYPALTLTVNVAANAPSSVINTATVSGGGETNASNNTASNPTTITCAGGGCGATPNAFLTGFTSGYLRNDFGSFAGMKFTVGSNALTVNSLGRICVAGNSGTHTIKLVDANAGVDVSGGSVSLNMAGCTPAQFKYASLPSNVTLPANKSYYLVTQETVGGDRWYEYGAVTTNNVAVVNNSVWFNGTNYVPVSGANTSYVPPNFLYGGSAPASADLTITETHIGNFAQGQTGATYTITVTNSGTVPTSAAVSVSDTVPAGLTATNIAGSGWSCTQPAGPCNRSDVLAAGASYPALTLTVNVAANAPSSVTNTATVSGGGETNAANNTANNPTTITCVGGGCGATPNPFLTGFTSGYLRNDFGSFAGMKFTVGATPLTVTSLGRICVGGNSGTHTIKLVDASTGNVVGSLSLSMAGCTAGQFKYAVLTNAVTLTANTAYYLASGESAGGDQWYEYGPVSSTTAGVVNNSVWFNGTTWVPVVGAGTSYAPPNFLYQ